MTSTKKPGLTLADLAAQSEDVPVGDSFITVRGVSAEDGLAVFVRFPALAELIGGFTMVKFIQAAPDAVAAIIATATGSPGDAEAEEAAKHVPLETQFDILEAVGRLTFKSGFGPFAERLMGLVNAANSGSSSRAPAMKSPPPSKPSSPPDTPLL